MTVRNKFNVGIASIILTLLAQTTGLFYFVGRGVWAVSQANAKLEILTINVETITQDVRKTVIRLEKIDEHERRLLKIENKLGL